MFDWHQAAGSSKFTHLKAAVNAPQSKRFARFGPARWSRKRPECGGFSPAFSFEKVQ